MTDRGHEVLELLEPAVRDAERSFEAYLDGHLEEYRAALEALVRAGRAALANEAADPR